MYQDLLFQIVRTQKMAFLHTLQKMGKILSSQEVQRDVKICTIISLVEVLAPMIVTELFQQERIVIYTAVLIFDGVIIYFILLICRHALIVFAVSDFKIANIVFLIRNILKKTGMRWQIRYFLIWKNNEYYEIFSHENSTHFISTILWRAYIEILIRQIFKRDDICGEMMRSKQIYQREVMLFKLQI